MYWDCWQLVCLFQLAASSASAVLPAFSVRCALLHGAPALLTSQTAHYLPIIFYTTVNCSASTLGE